MKLRNRDRIIAAVQLGPMTVQAVAKALMVNEENVRTTMQRLEAKRLVKRVGFQQRHGQMGASPYLWAAVVPSLAPARPVGRF